MIFGWVNFFYIGHTDRSIFLSCGNVEPFIFGSISLETQILIWMFEDGDCGTLILWLFDIDT